VLRRMFGPQGDEVTGEWRRLHNEELYVLFFSPNIIQVIESRRMTWTGYVARMGGGDAYRVLVGKSEGRRPVEIPRHRWEYNIKMDLREVGWGHELDRYGSGQGQVAGSCVCDKEPSGSIKCGELPD
jgi:hypothetical protein